MIDIRSKFTIDRCPNRPDLWYVDWTELGPVETDIAKFKICDLVINHIRPNLLGIGRNVPDYNDPNGQWAVQWIDFMAWVTLEDYQIPMFSRSLFGHPKLQQVDGIILETLDQAEQFVNLMEQQFTFHVLKRTYATDW